MSQNSLAEPTSGTLSGLSLVQGLNAALDTLNTLASGASAPAAPEVGQLWHDTGNNLLKIRSQDNTAWETVGSFDETNHLFTAALAASAATATLAATATVANGLAGTLGIANGGTGATSAGSALANLLSGSVVGPGNGGTGVSSLSSLYSSNFTVNGYRRTVIDGFMVQWETTGTIAAGSGASVFLPATFPNTCMAAVVCRNIGDASTGGANVYGWSANTVVVFNGSQIPAPITIIAIGY
jgi:hypothetical protein